MRPLATFNFEVIIQLPSGQGADGKNGSALCEAAFSECDGLEMTQEPKTVTEGGNNVRKVHLAGPVSYGQLTLKRGMTTTFDLWDWFSRATRPDGYALRADAVVSIYPTRAAIDVESNNDPVEPAASFILRRCLPVKMRVPTLNAKDGSIAIEEMQIVYDQMELQQLAGIVSDGAAPAE